MRHVGVRNGLHHTAHPQAHEMAIAHVARARIDVVLLRQLQLRRAPCLHHINVVAVIARGQNHALRRVELDMRPIRRLCDHARHAPFGSVRLPTAHKLPTAMLVEELRSMIFRIRFKLADSAGEAAVHPRLFAFGRGELLLVAELREPLAVHRIVLHFHRPARDFDAVALRLEHGVVPPVEIGTGALTPHAVDSLIGAVACVALQCKAHLVDILFAGLQAVRFLERRVDRADILAARLVRAERFDHGHRCAQLSSRRRSGQTRDAGTDHHHIERLLLGDIGYGFRHSAPGGCCRRPLRRAHGKLDRFDRSARRRLFARGSGRAACQPHARGHRRRGPKPKKRASIHLKGSHIRPLPFEASRPAVFPLPPLPKRTPGEEKPSRREGAEDDARSGKGGNAPDAKPRRLFIHPPIVRKPPFSAGKPSPILEYVAHHPR